jgi:hypothetical protein
MDDTTFLYDTYKTGILAGITTGTGMALGHPAIASLMAESSMLRPALTGRAGLLTRCAPPGVVTTKDLISKTLTLASSVVDRLASLLLLMESRKPTLI